jgi:hypothetical protein
MPSAAVTIAAEITPAMSPYLAAATPDSAVRKRNTSFFMILGTLDMLGTRDAAWIAMSLTPTRSGRVNAEPGYT